ncbi:MAG: hypothetical protein PHX51_07430 [Clostridia bacterium]|nr:hypothetical protein [Clostridia bacterium]
MKGKIFIVIVLAIALCLSGCSNKTVTVYKVKCWEDSESYSYTVSRDGSYSFNVVSGTIAVPSEVDGEYTVKLHFDQTLSLYVLETELVVYETYYTDVSAYFKTVAEYHSILDDAMRCTQNGDGTITFKNSVKTLSHFYNPDKTLYSKTVAFGAILIRTDEGYSPEYNDYTVETKSIGDDLVYELAFSEYQYPTYNELAGEHSLPLNGGVSYVDNATLFYTARSLEHASFKEASTTSLYSFDLVAGTTHTITAAYDAAYSPVSSTLNNTQEENLLPVSLLPTDAYNSQGAIYVYLDTSSDEDNTFWSTSADGNHDVIKKRAVIIKQNYMILKLNEYFG